LFINVRAIAGLENINKLLVNCIEIENLNKKLILNWQKDAKLHALFSDRRK
jgi:hypothetical protein